MHSVTVLCIDDNPQMWYTGYPSGRQVYGASETTGHSVVRAQY